MPDNIVYVGKKPVMVYVTACITCLNDSRNEGIVQVAARGQSISRVVDVIEVLKTFVKYDVYQVWFGTEVINQDGRDRNISTMKVILQKRTYK